MASFTEYFCDDLDVCVCACVCVCAGISVDNMFVILSALDGLGRREHSLPVPERTAAMMEHAGLSIMVTSFTDILALGIGATTVRRQHSLRQVHTETRAF